MYNVVIIGGNAAGCKAAARLSRLYSNYRITIIEKSSFVSFSSCGLPFYAAGDVSDLADLNKTSYGVLRNKKFFREVKGVRVLTKTEVQNIDADNKKVKCFDLEKHEEFELRYDYLILATGAKTVKPPFSYPSSPLISSFHSPTDSEIFRKKAQKGEINKAVIIGGGFIGCEMMEALTSLWGIETVLIEKEKSLLSAILDPEISTFVENSVVPDNIKLLLSTTVEKIELNDEGLPVVALANGEKINSDYVFYCLGVKPNTSLAEKLNIKIGEHSGILVDEQMRTSIPNIWAAGDCVEVKNIVTNKLDYFTFGSLANRMGRVAADCIDCGNSRSGSICFKGAVGTVSLKLFDSVVCAAGITEAKAQRLGFKTGSVIGSWYDRPDYYPEVKSLLGKLVYEKDSLKLLGLQLVGEGEVTRYIDVFSNLLSNNGTAGDLYNLEHGYTPANSLPISPLNNLGYMIINQEKGGPKNYNPLNLDSFNGIFIDVREPSEAEADTFSEKSIQIPLSELRLNSHDFDLEQPVMFVCEKGPRSYEAAKIFMNYGYRNVSYLAGGNYLYSKLKKFSNYIESTNE